MSEWNALKKGILRLTFLIHRKDFNSEVQEKKLSQYFQVSAIFPKQIARNTKSF
jgi:hypothetical protein